MYTRPGVERLLIREFPDCRPRRDDVYQRIKLAFCSRCLILIRSSARATLLPAVGPLLFLFFSHYRSLLSLSLCLFKSLFSAAAKRNEQMPITSVRGTRAIITRCRRPGAMLIKVFITDDEVILWRLCRGGGERDSVY